MKKGERVEGIRHFPRLNKIKCNLVLNELDYYGDNSLVAITDFQMSF